ncbi:lysozyme inhibitor LprI family protein [Paraburkholderia tuberum]|nr:lysozyme inhibitor LprI family protein [Paraburkholderia tuberum]
MNDAIASFARGGRGKNRHSVGNGKRRLLISTVMSLVLASSSISAIAAGLDCARATSSAEQTVCTLEGLRQADGRLSHVYGRLLGALPQQRVALRAAQLAWLKARDQCGANADCIDQRYQSRIADLQARLVDAVAYRPDAQDMAALGDLRALVEAERQREPTFPLDKVIEQLRIKTGVTSFDNVGGDGLDRAKFPTVRPKGVTPDEWKALQASGIDGGGENGTASYLLINLDGDGPRDLVIDTYSGGTGLFSCINTLSRKGGRFEGNYQRDGDDSLDGDGDDGTGQSCLYTLNGRGANQSGDWIRLRGRVYAAYRDSEYGVDDVYLIRPLTVVGEVPVLTVRYRYQLSVPVVQKKDDGHKTVTLESRLHTALTNALHSVGDEAARDAGSRTPLCPIPSTVKGDDREEYYSYGPGHYSYEIVGDMPIKVGNKCYLGRMVDWFGDYGKDGLTAEIWMREPGDAGADSEQTFTVHGIRTAIGTEMSIGKMAGDGGT